MLCRGAFRRGSPLLDRRDVALFARLRSSCALAFDGAAELFFELPRALLRFGFGNPAPALIPRLGFPSPAPSEQAAQFPADPGNSFLQERLLSLVANKGGLQQFCFRDLWVCN